MLLNLASSSSSFSSSATKMTTTTNALTCDLLALSSVVDNNNNNNSKIDSRRIRARRRRKGGENGDLNANGLIGLLALCCCLCFCCLISASSGFVIPAPKSSSSASSSHLFEVEVSRHGPLPAIQRLNHSETVPNSSSNKSSPVGSLSADSSSSSQSTRQRPKRHILPAQQQQPNYHHHQSSSSSSASTSESSLPINVRNGGGEVFRQVISANTDADYIRLEFTDTDGSLVRTLVDFRNNLQIFRLVRLGEQDLNERRWTTYCFITVLPPDEYISADAMSKLTQKNPATIRQAELDHGSALYNMDLKLKDEGERDYPEGSKLSSSNYDLHLLSPHLRNFCEHAQGRVYASEEDLLRWKTSSVSSEGSSPGSAAVRSFANVSSLFSRLNPPSSTRNSSASSNSAAAALSVPEFRQCGELLAKLYQNFSSSSSWQNSSSSSSSSSSSLPLGRSSDEALARHFLAAHQGELCHCSLSLVLPFYPCSVRHCTAPDPANPGKVVNYRCGIRTCRRRYEFRFAVADKLACLADFDPTVKLSDSAVDGSVDLQKEVVDEERMANNPQEADGNGKDTGDGEADPPLADNSVAANSKQV